MKFFCEYCGNRIDASVDRKCPNCGASYKKNQSFIKLEEERKKQAQTNQENKQILFNHALGALKFSKWLLLIPVFVFLIVLTIIIFAFGSARKVIDKQMEDNKNTQTQVKEDVDDFFQNVFDDLDVGLEEEKAEIIEVNIGEFAETKDYKVKVTSYEKEEDIFNRLDSGYEYVKFNLLVENLTNDEITKEDVNCIVDGVAQTNYYSSGYSKLPMFISKGLTVKGEAVFEVPKEAKNYEIKYGDNVIIKINK